MTYVVVLAADAAKELRALDKPVRARIQSKLRELGDDPRVAGVKKLKGYENAWRLRVGDYRVIYEILDGVLTVLVVRIAHRREVYDR